MRYIEFLMSCLRSGIFRTKFWSTDQIIKRDVVVQ
jgi:hypothetical protein